jgi:hypothetical protein
MPTISQSCFTDLTEDQQNYDIYSAIANLQGFQVPEYDQIDITYYGATNNIATVQYLKDGNPVATLTLTYAVQPPVANDANLTTVSIAYP